MAPADRTAKLREAILPLLPDDAGPQDWLADAIVAAVEGVLAEDETVEWRDEWQVVHRRYSDGGTCASCWASCATEKEARADAAQAVSEGTWGEVWIEHRRVASTDWEAVA